MFSVVVSTVAAATAVIIILVVVTVWKCKSRAQGIADFISECVLVLLHGTATCFSVAVSESRCVQASSEDTKTQTAVSGSSVESGGSGTRLMP